LHVFTSELTLGVPHDLTPAGYEALDEHYEFNAEGHRVVFEAKRLPGTGAINPEVWDSYWTGTQAGVFPSRINHSDDFLSTDGRYGSGGDIFYRTITGAAPLNFRLYRARIRYVDASQREILILGRNQVSIEPHSNSVSDFVVAPDDGHVAYRNETSAGGEAQLHLVRPDGTFIHQLSPDTGPTVRVLDYHFTSDSQFIYHAFSAGLIPTGRIKVMRAGVPSAAFPVEMLNLPMGAVTEILPQGDFFVIRVSALGAYNRLYSVRQGDTRLRKWVEDSSESVSEILQPHLEPDGCAIFYVRRIDGLVDGHTTGNQVWRALRDDGLPAADQPRMDRKWVLARLPAALRLRLQPLLLGRYGRRWRRWRRWR